ncbi:Cytochrome P450 9e2 [Zootermopsis nevadensis]|uniref:Cytochrome P450 9e2 n=1 Tax=Zootermopsis nevadensis TaxID=136037 RepID=A0A067QE34_ZOONE|nr:Cytochrome P450 9e2 [Zootermopsis nevadensis]
MFPPVVVGDRLCVKPYSLEADPPLEFQPGDRIFIPIYGLHHDADYFPDPERFDPERFSDANKPKVNPLAYLPFGSGPRSCIGKSSGFWYPRSGRGLGRLTTKNLSQDIRYLLNTKHECQPLGHGVRRFEGTYRLLS